MNTGEHNDRLCQKMAAEQERYRDWLLTRPPDEILDHAYKYSVREDLLMMMESKDLTEAQAKALLKSPAPLEDVYKAWEKQDTDYMEDLWAAMESRAEFSAIPVPFGISQWKPFFRGSTSARWTRLRSFGWGKSRAN